MKKDEFLKQLGSDKFLEGRADQSLAWSEAFQVRNSGLHYYIAWKATGAKVEGVEQFDSWWLAKIVLAKNWKTYLDEEFEKVVLIEE